MATDVVEGFVRSLRGISDVNSPYLRIQQWSEEGNLAILRELAIELERRGPDGSTELWVVESVVDHIESSAAVGRSAAHLDLLTELIRSPRVNTVQGERVPLKRVARTASFLASVQPPPSLVALLARTGSNDELLDFRACLFSELIVRRSEPTSDPEFLSFVDYLKRKGHPLAALESRLASFEKDVPLRAHTLRGASCANPFGPWDRETLPSLESPPASKWASVPEAVGASLIPSAVRNWKESSNGLFEAGVWEFGASRKGSCVHPQELMALGLDCLSGVTEQCLDVWSVPASTGYSILFGAAANGGAYNHGEGGGFGRLHAWESLCGLLGFERIPILEAMNRSVSESSWFCFQAKDGDWFQRVAWDIGVLVLRPDGRTMSLLAATDTD